MSYGIVAALLLMCIPGCSGPPSIPVFGAYFPDWLFCIAGGITLSAIAKSVLSALRAERALGPPVLSYLMLAILFTVLIWVVVFMQ